ncbi:PepSY-associated TM helix domain-containing protein [Azospirillum canadense]|uniref:PepSY-associated TM helix domain-containing protein n=1 Tax=Azospirillum canadense TaxID=403962 RepID=UPI0022271079|nr:PepSY-associated TM helix domain-containing protein [Azospirillum canadense]MCW2239775.1 putative iron-regulated membrane protein [Azospirillum canadense]
MTPASLRGWRLVHRWTSLICSVNLLILCVTGLILVFHHEIQHLMGEELDTTRTEGQAHLPLQSLVDIARKTDPALVPKLFSVDPDDAGGNYIYLGAPGLRDFEDGRWVVLNTQTGANQVLKPPEETLTGFLLKLHVDLFTGFPGQMFVGVMGILFVVSTVSGLVVYGPFMKKLAFGLLRFGRGPRIANIDLHNLFGVATLTWAFVVGLTGAILSFSPLIVSYWQNTELVAMAARHTEPMSGTPISIDQAAQAGQAAFPGKDLAFIAYPGNNYSSDRHFSVMVRGHTELTKRLLSVALVDAETGTVVETADTPWYMTVLLLSGPFHFGDYGGLPLQILWALFTIVTGVVTVTGFIAWVKRPRSRTAGAEERAVAASKEGSKA